ncbi:MAG: hypothetical protein AAFZ49_00735 [Cyanobacteria bacterium J06659_2]
MRLASLLLIVLINIVVFIGGVVVGVTGLIAIEDYLGAKVSVAGILMLETNDDPTASALPPKGYYVESSGAQRLYIDTAEVDGAAYLNRTIRAYGKLDTICGPDRLPCYPIVTQATLDEIPR